MKRQDIVDTINALKGNAGHKKVLEIYNNQKPLPQGYTVKYTDAWCAATVSAVFLLNGCNTFSECSCPRMVDKAKNAGLWCENDSYSPKIGDVVLYDWQDTGKGDNKGTPDHVGIVVEVIGTTFIVREGNKNNSIGNRVLTRDSKYIRGFILPKYEADKPKSKKTIDELAEEVIAGKWGAGDARKARLEAAGYNYNEIQERVNAKLNHNKKVYYEVKAGDTLSSIAKKYNTTVDKIAKLNNIKNINMIYPGEKLRIK